MSRRFGGYQLAALTLLVFVGFALRVHDLGDESLWLDEMLTIKFTRIGMQAMTGDTQHPPLYYLVAALPIRSIEDVTFAARIASVMFGTLSIATIALLASILAGPSTGLWAAFLLTISPFHLRYSQEARQYALLLLLSLLSYSSLLLALRRPKWPTWLAFALFTALSLWTHYASFVVLGTQSIIIFFWSVKQLLERRLKAIIFPVIAVGLSLLLYLPWYQRFIATLSINVGTDRVTDTGEFAPLGQWIASAYPAFGMYSNILAPILLVLCLIGLLYWFRDREWQKLVFVLCGLVLPFVIIVMFQVARGTLPRFVIYILPFFLIPAAYALGRSLRTINVRFGRTAHSVAVAACLAGFLLLARPLLAQEYSLVIDDWHGIFSYIVDNGDGDYAIAGLSLSNRNGNNSVKHALPFYFKEADMEIPYFWGNELKLDQIEQLTQIRPLWVVVEEWRSPQIWSAKLLGAEAFQSQKYVIAPSDQAMSVLDQLIAAYEGVIDLADSPSPLCYNQRDLATLYTAAGEYMLAEQLLVDSKRLCPDLNPWPATTIYAGLIREYASFATIEEKSQWAKKLLVFDPKNSSALEVLTVHSLLDSFERGEAIIASKGSPEPLRTMRLTMPETGDWGDAILIHPPAAVTFELALPEEATVFHSRIALAPETWSWGGDGATFVLRLQDEAGESVELLRRHVSMGQADRKWHDVLIPLSEFAGQEVKLTLTTEIGPAGDSIGDWAAWDAPRIMRAVP